MRLRVEDPLAQALVIAIHGGDLESLEKLLAEHPGLAAARIEGTRGGSRTPLHIATDWQGFEDGALKSTESFRATRVK